MLASLIAAFMSTVDTHINYGASFIVNDIYRRFLVRNASRRHYVRAAQVSTALMLAIAVVFAYNMESVGSAWYFMSMLTAGYGIVAVLRWFWWRINAWSEISALGMSALGSAVLSPRFAKWCGYWETISEFGWRTNIEFANAVYPINVSLSKWEYRFLLVVLVCTVTWLAVTFLTRPTPEQKLASFCEKVHPFPRFWKPIASRHPQISWNPYLKRSAAQWLLGAIATFCICFGIGHLIFLRFGLSLILLLAGSVSMYLALGPLARKVSAARAPGQNA
jgi:SSS family solute:Na+ symporter